jgi:hypothetical protein
MIQRKDLIRNFLISCKNKTRIWVRKSKISTILWSIFRNSSTRKKVSH